MLNKLLCTNKYVAIVN